MTKKQNILLKASIAIAVLFAIAPASNAMHIMEGYLQATFCIAWGVICLPFIVAGFFSIQKTLKQNRKTLILLAMSGAFVFVISSLKIPSVTGSCSHMTGTGLGAILLADGSRRVGADRVIISGNPAGTRRTDHAGSQYIFYGDRRSVSFLWDL